MNLHIIPSAALCAVLALSGCTPAPVTPEPSASASQEPTAVPASPEADVEPTPTVDPAVEEPLEPSTAPDPAPADPGQLHEVTRIVDGDTIHVTLNGTRATVRTLGIDTPETVHPSQPVECYGPEASNRAKELLSGQAVRLVTDPTQGSPSKDFPGYQADYYGRVLAYVELPQGLDYALSMVEGGYAEEYTYRNKPHARAEQYRAAQQLAQDTGAGMWGVC